MRFHLIYRRLRFIFLTKHFLLFPSFCIILIFTILLIGLIYLQDDKSVQDILYTSPSVSRGLSTSSSENNLHKAIVGRFRLLDNKNYDEKEIVFNEIVKKLNNEYDENKRLINNNLLSFIFYKLSSLISSLLSLVFYSPSSSSSLSLSSSSTSSPLSSLTSQLSLSSYNYMSETLKLNNITNYTQNDWQNVSGSKDKFYVYSAYYDDRNIRLRVIKVIAATRTRTSEIIKCKLWYNNYVYPSSAIVRASTKLIHENWSLKYSAYFINCLLNDYHPIPDGVTIFVDNTVYNRSKHKYLNKINYNLSNYLPVNNNPNTRKHLDKNNFSMAVCVKPLHYYYDKVLSIIEFIELNRLLGISHFIFYNHTIDTSVNCLLNYYIKRNLITILPWNLNIISQKEIRTEGLFAALNDCLYRTMYKFKYVLMIDLDEYIIPYRQTNLISLIIYLNSLNNNYEKAGAYSFQNAFFYLQWPNDELYVNESSSSSSSSSLSSSITSSSSSKASKTIIPSIETITTTTKKATLSTLDLITLTKTRRKIKLHIHKQRSKCIIIPRHVIEMGNHFVWEFVPGKTMVNVAPRNAFLHHYRNCEFGGDNCVDTPSTIDRRVYQWKDTLLLLVDRAINNYNAYCPYKNSIPSNNRSSTASISNNKINSNSSNNNSIN